MRRHRRVVVPRGPGKAPHHYEDESPRTTDVYVWYGDRVGLHLEMAPDGRFSVSYETTEGGISRGMHPLVAGRVHDDHVTIDGQCVPLLADHETGHYLAPERFAQRVEVRGTPCVTFEAAE